MMSVNLCVKLGDVGLSVSSDHCDMSVDRRQVGAFPWIGERDEG